MPRRSSSSGISAALRQVQKQASSLLRTLRREVRLKEAELKRLKAEQSRLGVLAGRARAPVAAAAARGAGRINWRAVLSQLPRQFKAGDIRKVRGLREKRPSEIFAAITRWIDAGMVKRKARGQYERSA